MTMRYTTRAALAASTAEKDVEGAYRGELTHTAGGAWMSPHNCDGLGQWKTVRLLLEAKYDQDLKGHLSVCAVLGQLLGYCKRFEAAGEVMPNVLMAGDRDECFVLSTESVRGFLDLDIDWSFAPSQGSPELKAALVQGFNLLPYVYDIDGTLDFKEVVEKIETLAQGSQHQVRAEPSNLEAIFMYWRDRVFVGKKKEALSPTDQVDVFLRCLFQPTDVYLHPVKKGVLVVPGYPSGVIINAAQYRSFFSHFRQGYKPSEVEVFYGMKDRLIEDDSRRRQGAFFTPVLWTDEAHRELEKSLGPGWREECVVWDCAAGTGNLTRDYRDWGCLLSSTLEPADVAVMQEQGWGGEAFTFDFLNDPRPPLSVDKTLRDAAEAGKRLVFFINPPYGTASAGVRGGTNKEGIAKTAVNDGMKEAKLGAPRQQLYAQFMFQCHRVAEQYGFAEYTVSLFSVPTFMSSGSYKKFRDWWYGGHHYEGGFLFQASHFADVKGRWGISFTVWSGGEGSMTRTDEDLPVQLLDVEDFKVVQIGSKAIYNSDGREASKWVREPVRGKKGVDAPQMSSGLTVKEIALPTCVIPGAVSYMGSNSNNIMKSGQGVALFSASYTDGHGFSVLPSNWRRAVALYGARKLVKETWDTQKDEYLVPDTTLPGYKSWVDMCHMYALLHTSNNCTAMRDVEYKGESWRIKNNWFWLPKKDALDLLDSVDTPTLYRDCQAEKDDPYFATVLPGLTLSPKALVVLGLLRGLWVKSLPVREAYAAGKPELHLEAWDAGVYQLKHLWRDLFPDDWKALKAAHKELADELRPGVYTYGFLKK
jgi:hypothetical protein